MATIINTIITFLVSTTLGYCVSRIKELKAKAEKKSKNELAQNEALKTLLQNSLTNIYYVYSEIGTIPDYALKNWINLLASYEALDGDDYIHELDTRIKKLKVKATGVIK